MKASERIFTHKKRRVLRKSIPRSEVWVGVAIVGLVAAMTGWVFAQRGAYDPADRDVSIETLKAQSVEDNLYRAPLQRWREPGAAGPGAAAAVDLGIFPSGFLPDGWTAGRMRVFTEDDLYEKINGQAEQYLKFGFEALHFLPLESPDETLDVFLYDQGAFANSLGIFSAMRDPGAQVASTGPVRWIATDVGAMGLLGKYFFQIVGTVTGPQLEQIREHLIGQLGELEGGAESQPRGLQILADGLGIPFERIAFRKTDVFQYDFASDFWFGALDDSDEKFVFVHEGSSSEEILGLFTDIASEHAIEYETVDSSDERILFRHRFLDSYFAMTRAGTLLLGVDGSADRERAEAKLEELVRTTQESQS